MIEIVHRIANRLGIPTETSEVDLRKGHQDFLTEVARAREKDPRFVEITRLAEEKRLTLLPAWSEPLMGRTPHLHRVAEAMADKWPALRISVVYVDRSSFLQAEPRRTVFESHSVRDTDTLLHHAEKALASDFSTTWPSFKEVQAYARAFDEACEREPPARKTERAEIQEAVAEVIFRLFPERRF